MRWQMLLLGLFVVVMGDRIPPSSKQKPSQQATQSPYVVYPVSSSNAYRILSQSTLPDFAFYSQCGILIHIYVEGSPDQHSITWRVISSGHEMLSFSALITPVDASHSRINISVPLEMNGREAYDGTQDYDRPAVLQPVRPAIEAQISSLMYGKKFDPPLSGKGRTHKAGSITTLPNNLGQKKRFSDGTCLLQRFGLEKGILFRYDDIPGMDAERSRQERRLRY